MILVLIIITICFDQDIIDKKILENFFSKKLLNIKKCFSSNFKIIDKPLNKNSLSFYDNINNCSDESTNLEHFYSQKQLPFIWIYIEDEISSKYWDSFYSRKSIQPTNSIINLCTKLITNYNKNIFDVIIINNENITKYINNKNLKLFYDNKQLKKIYIKYYLLYNYGGLWLEPDTIPFKKFTIISNKLKNYDLITFGYYNSSSVDDKIIGFKKHNKTNKEILKLIHNEINNLNPDFYYYGNIKSLLTQEKNRYHFDTSFDGSNDYKDNVITVENLVSHNYTLFKNQYNLLFINLNIDKIEKSINFKWLLRLSEEQLLQSNMWISKLFNYSNRSRQKIYSNNYNKYDIDIGMNKMNLYPDTKSELKNNIKNSNILPYSHYIIVDKEPIRNT